jgi:hypothetical protein
MSEESIKLSEKHGVNPSITLCPICGKEFGIALFGKLQNDEEAPKYTISYTPYEECIEKAGDNIYIVEVDSKQNKFLGRYILIPKENIIEEKQSESLLFMDTIDFKQLINDETDN